MNLLIKKPNLQKFKKNKEKIKILHMYDVLQNENNRKIAKG